MAKEDAKKKVGESTQEPKAEKSGSFYEIDPVPPNIIRQNVAAYHSAAVPAAVEAARVDAHLALEGLFRALPEELDLIRDLLRPWSSKGKEEDHRRGLALGLRGIVRRFWEQADFDEDPLAGVDEPLDDREAAAAMAWADLEARANRSALLEESVDSAEAGRRTNRTRQAVERQRRDGRVLALREGRQWRYPAWQFDVDGPGGLLPGLPEVIEKLRMSPAAAALWLSSPRPELGGDVPVERLRRRDIEPVVELAEGQGYWP